jgi:hypothetical protein
MATARLPSYVSKRKLASGVVAYYWLRPSWAAPPALRHGTTCPVVTTALGGDLPDAIRKADSLNAAFKEWRLGAVSQMAPGSVRWLFNWYRADERFTDLRHKTRTGYREMMNAVEAIPVKAGARAN